MCRPRLKCTVWIDTLITHLSDPPTLLVIANTGLSSLACATLKLT